MKHLVLLFLLVLSHQSILSQNKNANVEADLQTLLQEGVYSLKLVNMVVKEVDVEDNDDILYVDPETGAIELKNPQVQKPIERVSPVLEMRATGFVQYRISKKNQLLFLEPVQNKNMPSVTIDLAGNTVKVEGRKLKFVEKLQVSGNDNMFRSAWSGYRWNSESDTSKSAAYKFTVGKIEKTGQLYLEILGPDVSKDNKKGFYHFRFLS